MKTSKELTVEQLAVENFPLKLEFSNKYLNSDFPLDKIEQKNPICKDIFWYLIIDPPRWVNLLEDGTVLGFKEIREYLYVISFALPPKYKKFAYLLKKLESMSKEAVLTGFYQLLKKINASRALLFQEEREVLLKIFREPYDYLEQIEELYDLVHRKNTDVLKCLGINFEISPVTALYTIVNFEVSTKQKVALLYFTNINWYGKKVAPILFTAMCSHLNDVSAHLLVKITNRVFWEKVKNHVKTFADFYRKRLLLFSLTGSCSRFETFYLGFLLSLEDTSSDDLENFKRLLEKVKGKER